MKIERTRIHFFGDVFFAVAVHVLESKGPYCPQGNGKVSPLKQ